MNKSFPKLKTIAIAHPDGRVSNELTQSISKLGYEVLMEVPTVALLIPIVRSLKPHLALISIQPPEPQMFEIIELIAALRTTAMVTLLTDPDTTLALRSMDLGVSGYMLWPFDARHIDAILDSSWHHFHTLHALQDTLQHRQLLEKAELGSSLENEKIKKN